VTPWLAASSRDMDVGTSARSPGDQVPAPQTCDRPRFSSTPSATLIPEPPPETVREVARESR
jgi:hypothetical protein